MGLENLFREELNKSTKKLYEDQAEKLKETLLDFCPVEGKNLFKEISYKLKEKKEGLLDKYEVVWEAKINNSFYSNKDGCFCIEAYLNGGIIKDNSGNMIEIGPNRNEGLIPCKARS